MRNLLALAQARECGRAVSPDRLLLLAVSAGWVRQEVEAGLLDLEHQGLAHRTAAGWTLRSPPVTARVCIDHGRQVRVLH
jgi:hypothetical protein